MRFSTLLSSSLCRFAKDCLGRGRADEDADEEEEQGAGHKRKRGARPAEDEFFRYDDMEAFLQNAEKQRDAEDEDASAGGSGEDEEDSGERVVGLKDEQ